MDDAWRRRQAIQIASQLPEDSQDALAILSYARELVEGFLGRRDYRAFVDGPRLLPFPVAAARLS